MRVIYGPAGLPAGWPDVAAVVLVGREREVNSKRSAMAHDYVSSYAGSAAEIAGLIRGHWGIENGLHWVFCVAIREDGNRTRRGTPVPILGWCGGWPPRC